jgi:hypothetical protein
MKIGEIPPSAGALVLHRRLDNLVEFEKFLPGEVNRVTDMIWAALIHNPSDGQRRPFRLMCLFFIFLFFVIPWVVDSSTPLGGGDELVDHPMPGDF